MTIPPLELKSPHMEEKKNRKKKKVSHPPRKKRRRRKKKRKKTDATINRLQTVCSKNFPRGLSPNSAAWRARTVPGGGREAQRVNKQRLCGGSESVVLPHRMCASQRAGSAEKVSPTTLPSSPLSFSLSHLLQSPPSPEQATLRRGCAAQKNVRGRMRFTFLLRCTFSFLLLFFFFFYSWFVSEF